MTDSKPLSFNYRAAMTSDTRRSIIFSIFVLPVTIQIFTSKTDEVPLSSIFIVFIAASYLTYYLVLRHYSRLWLDDHGIHYHHPIFKHRSWHIPYSAIHSTELGFDPREGSQTLTLQHHEQTTTLQLDEWYLPNQPVELIPAFEHPIYLELKRRVLISDD